MAEAQARLAELSVWKAESLRITAFHQPGAQSLDNTWWEEVTGGLPESKTMRPREGGYEVTGTFAGGTLTLKADSLRFDWRLTVSISQESPPTDIPVIGPVTTAMESLLRPIRVWWPKVPPITRLAFGAVALQEVGDRVSGYELINEYLPAIDIDAEGSTEFSYSINRPRVAADLGGIKINRLTRWSVGRFQAMALTMAMGNAPVASATVGDPTHALRVELDINTDGDRKDPLPHEQLPALFDRLVTFGREILTSGDIK